MEQEFAGKKLLILGGNPETTPLVELANGMGILTIVTSARHTDPAKKAAWKAFDIDGMDVSGLIELAREEKVDGVLVGVADILVPAYCQVCEALQFPCYATQEIVDVFSFKDVFKATCERYGVHGVPEYPLDAEMRCEDLDRIEYPVVVKPVDNGGGVGITIANDEKELREAVKIALDASHKKKFIVEKYMQCDDVGIYYTFKDGYCSVSCVYDRYTTDEQSGLSRVNLGSVYPSRYINEYFQHMHENAVQMFKGIGIKNGVLLISAFFQDGEFYVYDPGFRLQGEAPHLLMKAIHGFDQREMLIRFALTGSEGDINLNVCDDSHFRGKHAATLWVLLQQGKVDRIYGLEHITEDARVVANVQRIFEGTTVEESWIGNEKQVMTRLYFVCDSRHELKDAIREYGDKIKVIDEQGNDMVLDRLSPEIIDKDFTMRGSKRTAVITGGTRGIGREIAKCLIRRGYRVAVIGRDTNKTRQMAEQIGARGYVCDISDVSQIEQTLKQIYHESGSIDVLVNNAGILDTSKIDTLTEAEWDKVLAINLKGAYFMIQKSLPYLERGIAPRIINISSNAGRMGGFENGLAYTASKGGLIALTYGAARRLASKGITVNCIAPGTIQTEMADNYDEEAKKRLLARFPVGRMGRPEEVAAAVCYFASEESGFTTGAVLDVNGGLFMG